MLRAIVIYGISKISEVGSGWDCPCSSAEAESTITISGASFFPNLLGREALAGGFVFPSQRFMAYIIAFMSYLFISIKLSYLAVIQFKLHEQEVGFYNGLNYTESRAPENDIVCH